MLTLALPVAQGAGVTGTQGIGVRTPCAAAVAEATTGFKIDVQFPNGIIFSIGTLSIMFAHGDFESTPCIGNTESDDGALPNEH